MQGFLDAKRATNICIPLCIKGFLCSRWSVEMTGRDIKNTTVVRGMLRLGSKSATSLYVGFESVTDLVEDQVNWGVL